MTLTVSLWNGEYLHDYEYSDVKKVSVEDGFLHICFNSGVCTGLNIQYVYSWHFEP